MFVNGEDYRVVIGETAMQAVSQVDWRNRENAEAEAVEEISGYLRPKYDCAAIFSAEGDSRNRQIVMYACDIALYHMSASLPGRMGAEVRKERYERAVKWLEKVQSGVVVPDLPLAQGDGSASGDGGVLFGSKRSVDNSY
jgi:phage gp36-like protein